MDVSNSEIVKATEHLLYDIHMGKHRQICNLCRNNIFWKYNHNCCKGIMDKRIIISINTIIRPSEVKEFEHIQYYINKLFYNYIIITGIYCIHKSEKTGVKKYYFDYIIVFTVDWQATYKYSVIISQQKFTEWCQSRKTFIICRNPKYYILRLWVVM